MQHPQLQEILAQLKAELQQVYGDRLKHLVLFGSQARGDAEEDSDVDMLVVLDELKNYCREIETTSEIRIKALQQYEALVSCVYIPEHRFLLEDVPMIRNAKREGLFL